MDRHQEEIHIEMAQSNPNMLCSEAPFEILEAASFSGEEPSEFMTLYFTAGHVEWLEQIHNRRIHLEQERIDRAVFVLWLRASNLYTSHLTGRDDPDWEKPIFSDEGLY